jgi:hypothetical protein
MMRVLLPTQTQPSDTLVLANMRYRSISAFFWSYFLQLLSLIGNLCFINFFLSETAFSVCALACGERAEIEGKPSRPNL